MQKRYLPILVCVVLTAAVAVIGYVIPGAKPAVPERILLDNAGGKVVFDHKTHYDGMGIECQKCHHESPRRRDNVQACDTCHGSVFDEAFRVNHVSTIKDPASCVTCHHIEFIAKKWGHKAHSAEYGVNCTDCHHKDTAIEPEPQNCANCHEPKGDKDMPSLRTAVHTRCKSCHEEIFGKKVKGCETCHTRVMTRDKLEKDGKVTISPQFARCSSCHTGQKAQDLVPGRMTAFHNQCMKCHEEVGKGPYTKTQCGQCHTK